MTARIPRRDLLARAYLDILTDREGASGKAMLRSGDPDDPIEQLLTDLSPGAEAGGKASIRADLAATAILVARSIEAVDGLTRDLRRGGPVVTLTTHAAELVAPVKHVLKNCAFGNDAVVKDISSFADNFGRPVLLVARDGTGSDHKPDRGNDVVGSALHHGAPVVGVAADPERHLPRDLLRSCEHSLSLGQLDATAIALTIEAVTGSAPAAKIDEDLVRAADVWDLPLAVRPDTTPEKCVELLEKIIRNKTIFVHRGPALEELAGYGEAYQLGINLVADLKEYKAGRLKWEAIENTALLVAGPPGTGKTQLAAAVAKSAGIPLVSASIAEFNSAQYLSGTLSRIKAVFEQARRLKPCVLLIDEIDGVGDRATMSDEYMLYWTQILNFLLEQISGVGDVSGVGEGRTGVVVIATSNWPDRVDPALRRAGRLDRTIVIDPPDTESFVRIFRYHLGPDLLKDVDLTPAALAATGGTGADAQSWVRRSKARARREQRDLVLDDLVRQIRSGREGLPEGLRKVVALHEAGHLVIGVGLGVFEPRAVSVFDEGGATRIDVIRAATQTEGGIENFIAMLLSGRAAEEVVLGKAERTVGGGAGGPESDFGRATNAAIDLELQLGFGALGVAQFSQRATEMLLHDPDMLALVKRRIDRLYRRACELVSANHAAIGAVSDRLDRAGYLDRQAIDDVLKDHPFDAAAAAPIDNTEEA
jgi:ATP-dependent Zn protease